MPLLLRLTRHRDAPAEERPPTVSSPRRPLLLPGHRVVCEGTRVLVERGERVVALEGRAAATFVPALIPLLDGDHDLEALAAELGVAARPAIERALLLLASHGLVCEGPSLRGLPRALRETAEFVAAETGRRPAAVGEALGSATVVVVGRSPAAAFALELFEECGIRARREGQWRRANAPLVVAAPGRGEAGALSRLNRRALRRRTTWLPIWPFDGRVGAIGPLIVPGETPCFHCVQLRRAAAVDYGDELLALETRAPAARAPAALDRLTAEVAVLQALRWLGARDAAVPGVLLAVEPRSVPPVGRHEVLRVPRCPACSGAGDVAAPLPWDDLPVERAA